MWVDCLKTLSTENSCSTQETLARPKSFGYLWKMLSEARKIVAQKYRAGFRSHYGPARFHNILKIWMDSRNSGQTKIYRKSVSDTYTCPFNEIFSLQRVRLSFRTYWLVGQWKKFWLWQKRRAGFRSHYGTTRFHIIVSELLASQSLNIACKIVEA